MAALGGIAMSLGTIPQLAQATGQAVAAPGADAQTYVGAQPRVHLDETGWRAGHTRAWLWVAVTAGITVCVVRLSRGAQGAQARWGERVCGIVVTARWRAYTWYPTRGRQGCWAQRRRDCAAMLARGGRSQASGEARREQARQLLHWWHRVRDGPLTRHPHEAKTVTLPWASTIVVSFWC